MDSKPLIALALVGVMAGYVATRRPAPPEPEVLEHLTPPYAVSALYPSMKGPAYTNQELRLSQGAPELLWIQGYEAVMVGPDGTSPKPQQFMCHNTLSIHRGLDQHRRLFGAEPYGTRRLFTLSQGQYKVRFPEGFGIPIVSTETLMLQSQVLNLNPKAIGETVRHRIRTEFVRDQGLPQPMKPLCMIPSGITVKVADPQAAKVPEDPLQLGCSLDVNRNPKTGHAVDAGGAPLVKNREGDLVTGHWMVKPGQEERITDVGSIFPFDTTVHYISVHVHPGAELFQIRDLDQERTLFEARGEQLQQGLGLDRISHFSSPEGIPVFRDHRYQLRVTYRNQGNSPQSAMAFMFCYILDKGFHPPTEQALQASDESFCGRPQPDMLR